MNTECVATRPLTVPWFVGIMIAPEVRVPVEREELLHALAEALVPPADWREYRPLRMGSGREEPDFDAADIKARRRLDAAEKHAPLVDGHTVWSSPYASRADAERHAARYDIQGILVGIVETECPPPVAPASTEHAGLLRRLHGAWLASERSTARFALGQYADSYWGACPVCFKEGGCLNVGREHWFVCDEHKTKWCVGSNLFSNWREESKETHRENAELLRGYREVEPRHYKPRIAAIVAERQREIDEARAARALGAPCGADAGSLVRVPSSPTPAAGTEAEPGKKGVESREMPSWLPMKRSVKWIDHGQERELEVDWSPDDPSDSGRPTCSCMAMVLAGKWPLFGRGRSGISADIGADRRREIECELAGGAYAWRLPLE